MLRTINKIKGKVLALRTPKVLHDLPFNDGSKSNTSGYGKSEHKYYQVNYFIGSVPHSSGYICRKNDDFDIAQFKRNLAEKSKTNNNVVTVSDWKVISMQEYTDTYD